MHTVQLIHIVVQQKLTQHCNIILQLKNKNGRELSKWIQGCIKEKNTQPLEMRYLHLVETLLLGASTKEVPPKQIPWAEEPGEPQSMGSQGVGHGRSTEHINIM